MCVQEVGFICFELRAFIAGDDLAGMGGGVYHTRLYSCFAVAWIIYTISS